MRKIKQFICNIDWGMVWTTIMVIGVIFYIFVLIKACSI
jgi:hypothetical protein